VLTIHREANVDAARLEPIVRAAARLPRDVVFPTHPRTRSVIERARIDVGTVRMVEPLGYLDFTSLASQAAAIVTDSGGLQKEAYWYGVPCVTVRPSTEWVDTVEAGANVLVEPGGEIVDAVERAVFPVDAPPLYGDGHASERIARVLLDTLSRA
jgi:UDP-N-acetylglucosamine 2-epimerase (non-hydrolysing)/UDP-GlcNAc3NAcA epimerase